MFTGIVTDIGDIRSLERRGDLRARIGTGYHTHGIDIGASIACSGVCLTVVQLGSDWFDVEISAETLDKTNVGAWGVGQKINLERALKVGDELGGHIVSGHIDGLATITEM
ncbi:MAG: riboflavin synthase, partial [Marivita lacus]|nr:riboflavin synthase [Marivita lacus]